MEAGAVDLADLDLTDLDLFVGGFPHQVFAALRRQAPVFWHPPTAHTPDGVGFFVLSRYREVAEVAADPLTFSSERAPGCPGGGTILQDLPYGFAAGVLLNMTDDPAHHRLRRLATPSVAPRALVALEGELRRRTATLLESVQERGCCDFLTEVALELPIQATCHLLGVPQEDRLLLVRWTNATLAYEGRELDESSAEAEEASRSMAAYAATVVEHKRRRPADDLLSVVVHALVEGEDGRPRRLSDLELQMFFSLMVAAGSETTRNAIALGVAALAEHPDQLEALRADRQLLPTTVEEILRWSSPTLYNRRTATTDTELAGHQVARGDKVTLWWASADFDETVFADPYRFDVARRPNPHLAFGHRTHFCLGANLARLEVRVVLEEMLERFEAFELAGPVRRVRTNKHAGVSSLPLRVHPRAA